MYATRAVLILNLGETIQIYTVSRPTLNELWRLDVGPA